MCNFCSYHECSLGERCGSIISTAMISKDNKPPLIECEVCKKKSNGDFVFQDMKTKCVECYRAKLKDVLEEG